MQLGNIEENLSTQQPDYLSTRPTGESYVVYRVVCFACKAAPKGPANSTTIMIGKVVRSLHALLVNDVSSQCDVHIGLLASHDVCTFRTPLLIPDPAFQRDLQCAYYVPGVAPWR